MESVLKTAEREYITKWNANALQHFVDGDYEWICNLIRKISPQKSFTKVFEIGCGVGYSTLTFALSGFDVLTIDVNSEAIQSARNLLKTYECSTQLFDMQCDSFSEANVHLCEIDLLQKSNEISKVIAARKMDLIVLCNPGGKIGTELTEKEHENLLWGGFTEEEISYRVKTNAIGLLHKWAMIYATCRVAKLSDIPMLIVDRGTRLEVQQTLEVIHKNAQIKKVKQAYREIKNAPEMGIPLATLEKDVEEQYWGMALYYP